MDLTDEFKKQYPHLAALKYFDYNISSKRRVNHMLTTKQLSWEQLFSFLHKRGWL